MNKVWDCPGHPLQSWNKEGLIFSMWGCQLKAFCCQHFQHLGKEFLHSGRNSSWAVHHSVHYGNPFLPLRCTSSYKLRAVPLGLWCSFP